MKRILAILAAAPLMMAAGNSDERAVRGVLAKMMAGEPVPSEILDQQPGHPEFANLDKAIADAKGCKIGVLDELQTGNYGVQWSCKGRQKADRPSAMIVYVNHGEVTRITTARAM